MFINSGKDEKGKKTSHEVALRYKSGIIRGDIELYLVLIFDTVNLNGKWSFTVWEEECNIQTAYRNIFQFRVVPFVQLQDDTRDFILPH